MHQTQSSRHKVPKGWGGEDWIVNKELYCGKKMTVLQNKKCSWHYHLQKDETFYLQSGHILLRTGWDDDISQAEQINLLPGDSFYIPVGLRHQFEALQDSELFEFSTEHFDEDSIRIIRGD